MLFGMHIHIYVCVRLHKCVFVYVCARGEEKQDVPSVLQPRSVCFQTATLHSRPATTGFFLVLFFPPVFFIIRHCEGEKKDTRVVVGGG